MIGGPLRMSFAFLALGHFLFAGFRIHDFGIHVGHGHADAARFAFIDERVEKYGCAAFGQAEHFDNPAAGDPFEFLHGFHRERCGSADTVPDAGQVVVFHVRMVHDADEHGGYAREPRGFHVADGLKHQAGVVLRDQVDGISSMDAETHNSVAHDVEQWIDQHERVFLRLDLGVQRIHYMGAVNLASVGQNSALAAPGGAAGVQDQGRVVGRGRAVWVFRWFSVHEVVQEFGSLGDRQIHAGNGHDHEFFQGRVFDDIVHVPGKQAQHHAQSGPGIGQDVRQFTAGI
jgi:hypothetical protein